MESDRREEKESSMRLATRKNGGASGGLQRDRTTPGEWRNGDGDGDRCANKSEDVRL